MNGLDRILEQIKNDSAAAVKEINDEAERTVTDNNRRIQAETEKELEKIRLKTKAECVDIIKRGESAAALAKKQTLLNAKQAAISDTINKAHERLLSLPRDEYFDIIEKMIKKNVHRGEKGEISFNENDLNRMSKSFKLKLLAISGAGLTLSDKKADIDGGFVLIYGGVEENCSFGAIFSERHDELQDKVCSMLFS